MEDQDLGGDVNEVKISSVSTTQCPAHSDTHSSIGIFREVNTQQSGNRGGPWGNELSASII